MSLYSILEFTSTYIDIRDSAIGNYAGTTWKQKAHNNYIVKKEKEKSISLMAACTVSDPDPDAVLRTKPVRRSDPLEAASPLFSFSHILDLSLPVLFSPPPFSPLLFGRRCGWRNQHWSYRGPPFCNYHTLLGCCWLPAHPLERPV